MTPASIFARVRATGRLWNTLLIVLDAAVVLCATVLAYEARFEGTIPASFDRWVMPLVGVAVVLYGVTFALFGLYRLVLRFVGVDTLLRLLAATAIGFAVLLGADMLAPLEAGMRPIPIGVLFIQAVLVFLGASAARMTARVFLYLRTSRSSSGRRVLIIGAGSAGSLLLREIQNRPDLGLTAVGFLDDEPALKGRTIGGVHVLGTPADLARIVAERDVDEIVVALPSAPKDRIRAVLNAAADVGIETRVMPEIVIAKGSVNLRDLRTVDVEDLLGRELTPIDVDEVAGTIRGKVVAVTGAAGSIGAELCRQIMRFEPASLLLLEIDETRLYELWLELTAGGSTAPVMCICDIRDAPRLDALMRTHQPELVLHAAAYKHVPLMELAPREAIKTNVLGTLNVVEACRVHDVARFVLISTDKAVAPVNTMGLTKSLAERIMLDAVAAGVLNGVAVRFGNVLASRGSVVPIFEEQLRHGGPLTVTDPDVTRYFMTIPEASRLVLQAQAIGEPGDIFVLEMGDPVRIVDLARKMIALSGVPADIEFIGLRPGEKLHESLVTQGESLEPARREKILRVCRTAEESPTFSTDVRMLIDAAIDARSDVMRELVQRLEPGFAERELLGS
ncbi:MAG: hypothetical protein CVT59_08755 [Actinobacteria bacterium HGW-Actinobacteria-1]|jgi:FlaA1/EpsC-like NDP-sugar epimerase|nr:MAG: hypothetical protein CVT59_08755 [Actinobacteria bacterium HGW-Actinobacteria-1]